MDSERCFLKASEIKIDRKPIISALMLKFRHDCSDGKPTSGPYGPFYERIRRAQGEIEFDAIDSQYMAFFYGLSPLPDENQLKHMLRALALPWPDPQDPLFITDKNSFKKDVPGIFYKFGKFNEAKNYLLTFPPTALDAKHLKILATIFAMEKNWISSFEYFTSYWDKIANSSSLLVSPEELMTLLQMLSTRSASELKKYGYPWIEKLMKLYPEAKSVLRVILPPNGKMRKPDTDALKSILAHQILKNSSKEFRYFDSEYQKLWGHASALPEDDIHQLLSPVQDIAQKISEQFKALMDLMSEGSDLNLLKIREQNDHFLLAIQLFSIMRKKVDHEISRCRRELFQKSQDHGQAYFVESPWSTSYSSIKAEVLSMHKQAEERAQKKLVPCIQRNPAPQPACLVGNNDEKAHNVMSIEKDGLCLFKDAQLR